MSNGQIDDSRTIGRRLREVRRARRKSLRVVAGLAGISAAHLSRLETGQRALDRRSLIVALANALEVAPSELTGAVTAIPRTGADDVALSQVRLALLAVGMGEPAGEAQPAERLEARVTEIIAGQNDCRAAEVGAALPSLIRDLHTTVDDARDERTVLRLLALAHMQGTQAWLTMIGAPMDLAWQAAILARQAAERLDEAIPLAVSAYGTALGLLAAGAFDLASRTLTAVDVPLVRTQDMRRSVYWREYSRALARLPKQHDAAVMMLRKAERISPEHVQRHPFTRETIAELVTRARRDAVGRELRGIAYRAGLAV